MAGLLERDRELLGIATLLEASAGADGGVVLIEGPAGIGKTALLESATRSAEMKGIHVLSARGGELERDFAYSVVRDLFAAALAAAGTEARAELLVGAAGLAAPLIAPDLAGPAPLAVGDPAFAVLHGLYWLTVNLARRRPLVIVVDDAHWCDQPSLRFLLYLVRRIEGLAVAILLAARAGDPSAETELLGQLASDEATRVLEPGALSVAGVAELVRVSLGGSDERFVLACHDATGGNPFLTAELLGELSRGGIAPSADEIRQVTALRPKTVRRAIVLRLAQLPSPAHRLAQSVAVLGGNAQLRHAAALAELDEPAASAAADTLASVEILKPQLPLEFVHPIVRAAVYDDLAPAARAAAHARASRVLLQAGAQAEQVAAHLLVCEPLGEPWVVEQLRAAAGAALARGAPETALVHLERALAEPANTSIRSSLLFELGRTQATIRDPRAIPSLEQALALTDEPGERMGVLELLFILLVYSGRWDAAISLVDATLAEVGGREPGIAERLEAMRAVTAAYDPELVDRFDRDHSRLRELALRGGSPGRGLALLLAANAVWRTGDPAEALALVELGLDGGRLLQEEGAEGWAFGQAMTALVPLDELDLAGDLAQDILADAARRGSVIGVCAGSSFAGYVFARRGALRQAEAQLRVGFRLAIEHGVTFGLPSILSYAIDVIPERPGLADLAEFVEQIELPPAFEATASGALLLDTRARLRLLRGEKRAGIEDLERCAGIFTATHLSNPLVSCWRSTLALAVRADDPERAQMLVSEELELARVTGSPRAIGVSLRALGLVAGGDAGIELLREAAETLRRCPSSLEQARAFTALGGALRRAGRRAEAREPLREALELARHSGADTLAERAEQELRAAGAKPRRLAFSGVDSLTASELRVAEMAAAGLSNQQVAEALFVTAKTIENHLGHVYQKLGIHSREQVDSALRGVSEPAREPDAPTVL
jgi:DNA-binding CsgD family transcriptional regulator